jgi:uncharacterized protein (DUF934 family)
MATLIRNRQVVESPFPPEAGDVLQIQPADDVAALADRLAGASRVEIHFPKFGDGRGFSIAKLLRTRYGYRGELRAVGHVVRDHLGPMEQVGFDSFLLKDGEDAEVALQAFSDFPIFAPWDTRR